METLALILEREFKHAKIQSVADAPGIVIVEATSTYIPIDEFKLIFNTVGDRMKQSPIRKLIFDKRKLAVFHQPSMEWYFVEWKEQMFDLGLTVHRKILPNDAVFRQSVKIGRNKIKEIFPQGKYNLMDIQYAETLEEAIRQ